MVTLQDICTLITEETQKLNKIGYYPVEVKTIKFVKSRSFYADAWRNLNMIRVSEYYREAPIQEIRATIMHELCHMVPSSGRGHGKEWKSIADAVNKAYPTYNIKRIGSNIAGQDYDWSLRRAANKDYAESISRKVIMVKCPSCGCIWTRHRESNLTLHPGLYRCKSCRVTLVRI